MPLAHKRDEVKAFFAATATNGLQFVALKLPVFQPRNHNTNNKNKINNK